MKHVFVINPNAGKTDATQRIKEKINALDATIDHEIYVTQKPGDATSFVRQWCTNHSQEPVRFYACGGDGTLNEVVTGLIGFPHAQVTCHASGSGNDYIKYYGTLEDFQNISRLIDGEVHKVDVMRVNDRYSINVCNFGFDALVCKTMNKVRHIPIIGGRNAYTTGIIHNLFTGRRNSCSISVDGKPFHDGKILLSTFCNGQYVGGNYKCAPLSKNDDGLLEVSLFHPISIIRLAQLIGDYVTGEHINRPDIKKIMKYCQGKVVEIMTPKDSQICIDGELFSAKHYHIENIPQAISFVSPKHQ